MFLDDSAHRTANAFGFVAIKTRGFDRAFQLGLRRVGIIFRGPIFLEQRRRDHVDPLISGLGGENCGHQQFQRVAKIQLTMRAWVYFRPGFQKLGNALASRHLVIILQACYVFQR